MAKTPKWKVLYNKNKKVIITTLVALLFFSGAVGILFTSPAGKLSTDSSVASEDADSSSGEQSVCECVVGETLFFKRTIIITLEGKNFEYNFDCVIICKNIPCDKHTEINQGGIIKKPDGMFLRDSGGHYVCDNDPFLDAMKAFCEEYPDVCDNIVIDQPDGSQNTIWFYLYPSLPGSIPVPIEELKEKIKWDKNSKIKKVPGAVCDCKVPSTQDFYSSSGNYRRTCQNAQCTPCSSSVKGLWSDWKKL